VGVAGQPEMVTEAAHQMYPAMPMEYNNIVAIGTDFYENMIALRFSS
jgi:hypothetical protein